MKLKICSSPTKTLLPDNTAPEATTPARVPPKRDSYSFVATTYPCVGSETRKAEVRLKIEGSLVCIWIAMPDKGTYVGWHLQRFIRGLASDESAIHIVSSVAGVRFAYIEGVELSVFNQKITQLQNDGFLRIEEEIYHDDLRTTTSKQRKSIDRKMKEKSGTWQMNRGLMNELRFGLT